jgi:replicative DNA helicase
MINAYQENIFFHYILSEPRFLNVCRREHFSNSTVQELFEIAKDHTLKYKDPPSKDQMYELVRIKGLSDKITEEQLTALYNSKVSMDQYGNDWLDQNVSPWIQVRNLEYVMRKAIAYMKTSTMNVENASTVVESIRHMISSETAIDFNFNMGVDFFDPTAHLQTRLAKSSSGYDYIDLCLKGGYWKGSLIAFLSGPKAGKSMWLGNLALRSAQMGNNTAYVSFELQQEIINLRIGSNLFNVTMDAYEEWAKDQDNLKKRMSDIKQDSFIPFGKLHVKEFPASTCSVNDLKAYLKKTEEILGIKFSNVFVDYINIMKNWRNPNTENTYMKIKQIAEDLRAMAMEEQWTVITATQTNRGGIDNTDLRTTDVSESAALLHTVDVLFGIITDPEMKARGEYFLKCLANRVSGYQNTRKRYTIDWHYARIEEDKASPIQDMDFLINNTVSGSRHPFPRGGGSIGMHAYVSQNAVPEVPTDAGSSISISGAGLF